MKSTWKSISVFSLASLVAHPAAAQVLYGTVLGSVRDQSGGGVPSAEVRITNKATGLIRDTKTNETGLYTFSNVQAGDYDVEVKAPGFRPFTQQGISVTINTVARVDVDLQIGQIT